ncbi:MAG: DUF2207 domain-containing protein, partial [Actinobacteria bacterium]|nr:DUF2207 domain-containing protein [Actinomycetota bacterium]
MALCLAGLLAAAPPAWAKEYSLPAADVEVVVEADGSLRVTEQITYSFSGSFSGGYREIPLRPGMSIDDIAVSEEAGRPYSPGAPTALGSSGRAGTFGVENLGGRMRVVWHYRAADERRTFTLTYRMLGLTVAYDDVADVYLKVWGDEWKVGLSHLTARVVLPSADLAPGDVLVYGHPARVQGETTLGADGVSPALEARGVPARQWVEMRVVFPRRVLAATAGAAVADGSALEVIRSEEAAAAERAAASGRGVVPSLWLVGGLLAGVPAALYAGYRRYGKEPRVDYDREYEQAPPSDLEPALVSALLSQGRVDEKAFTATLFDLIRRGVLTATPETVERKTWGGLRREQISDLVIGLAAGDHGPLREHETRVMTVMRRVLEEGPQPLTQFRTRIRADAQVNAATYNGYRESVGRALTRGHLLDEAGLKAGTWMMAAGVVLAAGGWFLAPLLPWVSAAENPAGALVTRFGFVAVGALALLAGAVTRSGRALWVRRTKEGALEAARWSAFRRYLADFSRLHEAPAISLKLWEQFLVYAIALGVAEDVLEAARLYAPPTLEETSSLYWYSGHGYGGHSENALAGIERALTGAFAPPGGSGGGGGFS